MEQQQERFEGRDIMENKERNGPTPNYRRCRSGFASISHDLYEEPTNRLSAHEKQNLPFTNIAMSGSNHSLVSWCKIGGREKGGGGVGQRDGGRAGGGAGREGEEKPTGTAEPNRKRRVLRERLALPVRSALGRASFDNKI